MELNIPAIKGIGDSLIHFFVDRWHGTGNGAAPGSIGNISIYDVDFSLIDGAAAQPAGHGLTNIDHLTHNAPRPHGNGPTSYERLFNFAGEARYFDIEGKFHRAEEQGHDQPPAARSASPSTRAATTRARSPEYLTSTTAKASSTSRWAPTTSMPR